ASRPPTRRQRDAVQHVKGVLAHTLGERVGLDSFAREAGLSAFHLCRAFRAVTGSTLHAYRNRLRLHRALEGLADGAPLVDLALDLGYSSHSHFSAAFRRGFRATPSAVRRALGARGPGRGYRALRGT